MTRRKLIAAVFVSLSAFPATAFADVKIENAWVRATVGAGKVSAGYGTIINTGDNADALIGISTPLSMMADLHESKEENGMMTMDPVDALAIPAQSRIELKPGGYHIMIMDLSRPLKVGETIDLKFAFKKQGDVTVKAKVLPLSAKAYN